jgi:signal transduction histidine kinase
MPLRLIFESFRNPAQNINKYANPDFITIELTKQENHLLLVISDNGIGFNSKLKKGNRNTKHAFAN